MKAWADDAKKCGRGRTAETTFDEVAPIVHVFIDDSLMIVSVPLTACGIKRLQRACVTAI